MATPAATPAQPTLLVSMARALAAAVHWLHLCWRDKLMWLEATLAKAATEEAPAAAGPAATLVMGPTTGPNDEVLWACRGGGWQQRQQQQQQPR